MGDLKKENNRKSAQWMANFANKKKIIKINAFVDKKPFTIFKLLFMKIEA